MTKHQHILVAALLMGAAACSNASGPEASKQAYDRGVAALQAGQPRTARVEFMNAIKADPNNGGARIMQAQVYLALGANPFTAGFISLAKRLRKCLASRVASPWRSARLGIFTTTSASR